MGLRPSNRMSIVEAQAAGILPATQARPDAHQVVNRKSASMKPPAPSRDARRPWLDTVLQRFDWKGHLEPEQSISVDFAERLVLAEIDGRCRCVFQHVANEGKRSAATGALLKMMGMFPGAEDWWFMGQSWGCGVIELKTPDGKRDPVSRLSPAQKDHRAWCLHHGVRHAVCTSVEEAWRTLVEWGAVVE